MRPHMRLRAGRLAAADGLVQDGGPGLCALGLRVRVKELDIVFRQAHTNLHTTDTTIFTTEVAR